MAISDAPKHLQPWLRHLAAFRKAHPRMPYLAAREKASLLWHAKKGKKKTGTKKIGTKKTGTKKRKSTMKKKKYYGKTKRPYLTGAAWHNDHYQFNKNEDYEIPVRKRKVAVRKRK